MLKTILPGILVCLLASPNWAETLVVKAKLIHTVSGKSIANGAIVCVDGKIASIGEIATVVIPEGAKVIQAEVVTPGLIDVRSSVGLSGILNVDHDSDHLESSAPLQPELRAIDAYNPREELIEYVRGFGITTVHTGHAPGELISGQTMIAKTRGGTVQDALVFDGKAVCATLTESSQKTGKQSPGTRGKQMAMLRALLIEASEYRSKLNKQSKETDASDDSKVARNLKLETIVDVLDGKKALLITADRAQDIASALRLGEEFSIRIWLDSAAEAYQLIPQIKKAGVPVLLHPSMARANGDRENMTFRSASILKESGIPFAIESGFEAYVPKVRIVLFEAALAAAHGLSKDAALESITLSAAKILGIEDRVGSIDVGKEADLALYDGDPLEYTTHCTSVVIDGVVYPGESR
ncbi:MAG: amidohydrolase family protein [Planctomycetaceae bacterium]|jgi:imidazolonepropionase-like amidohydrolase|nr:amidohydrolase family protein [Planctomycetaceae bacterium]MCE2813177.1 amidohydrolase family protein [Planctomycetaceae bacterium]